MQISKMLTQCKTLGTVSSAQSYMKDISLTDNQIHLFSSIAALACPSKDSTVKYDLYKKLHPETKLALLYYLNFDNKTKLFYHPSYKRV